MSAAIWFETMADIVRNCFFQSDAPRKTKAIGNSAALSDLLQAQADLFPIFRAFVQTMPQIHVKKVAKNG